MKKEFTTIMISKNLKAFLKEEKDKLSYDISYPAFIKYLLECHKIKNTNHLDDSEDWIRKNK